MRFLRLVLIIGTLFALVACGQEPAGVTDIPCDVMNAHGLVELRGQQKTPAEWQQIIAASTDALVQYSSSESKIGERRQTNTFYKWKVGNAAYTLITVDDRLVDIIIHFGDYGRQPALTSVLACLGQPDEYDIYYGQWPDGWSPRYFMAYYYTNRGIVLRGDVRAPTLKTCADLALLNQPLTASTALWGISWLSPGDVRDLDWQDSSPTGGTEGEKLAFKAREEVYAWVRPWPGALDRAEVTRIDPTRLPSVDESPLPTPAAP